jgi:hypothetical protein
MKKIVIALLLGCAAALNAHAQAEDTDLRWYAAFGVAYGGDSLHDGSYSIGTSYSIRAGDAIMLRMGLSYQVKEDFDLQLSVGYETTTTNAYDGKVQFTRVPAELMGFFDAGSQWRLGLGLRYASAAKLSTSGSVASIGNFEYTPTIGRVIEVQYMFDSTRRDKVQYGVSLRLINESYQEKITQTNYNGNSSGLSLFAYF